jgi:carbonic anhydrase
MAGLLDLKSLNTMPTVESWLKHSEAALRIAQARTEGNQPPAIELLIEENVLLQLSHLRTHASVAGRLAMGSLAVHGWVYDVGTGSVRMYDEARKSFFEVNPLEDHENAKEAAASLKS